MAGGLDTFDWLKDRTKRPSVVVDLSQVRRAARDQGGQRRPRDRRDDAADRGGQPPGGEGEVRAADGSGRTGGLAADSQSGDARREHLAGHALLVLPERLVVLPRGRQHLLRGHADGDQPRARDPGAGPLRGGESVGHGAGADCAGRGAGDPERARRAGGEGRRLLRRARRSTSCG